jgi:hypothetical protein
MAKRRTPLSPELKAAIADLPDKEKNRLLYRLIPKDDLLVDQLTYKLLEEGETQEERREDLQREIRDHLNQVRFHSPGYLLLDLRSISGSITRHVRTTKDKYGEIALNFFMLNHALDLMGKRITSASPHQSRTFDIYLVKRAAKLLTLLDKIHLDYQLDFEEQIRMLGQHLRRQPNALRRSSELSIDLTRYLK